LMLVGSGSAAVEAEGYGIMVAQAGDVIRIPDYTEHTITALEPGTVIQDFNVQFDMFLMMDEIEATMRTKPEAAGPGFFKEIFTRYGCPLTALSGILEV